MDGYFTVPQAAKSQNVTRQALYLAIRENKLKTFKDHKNDRLLVLQSDLKRYVDNKYSRKERAFFEGKPLYDEKAGELTMQMAADRIGVDRQTLYHACRKGMLKYIRRSTAMIVREEDLNSYWCRYVKE